MTSKLSRRDFLKLGAATSAAAGLAAGGGTSLKYFAARAEGAESPAEDKIYYTGCWGICGTMDLLKVHVRDGIVTQIETDPEVRACVKGRSWKNQIYSADRLKYPMKRRGERGSGDFEQISWDEALDTIARQITETQKNYGPEALLVYPSRGEATFVNKGLLYRLFAILGGYTKVRGSLCIANKMSASTFTLGTPFSENDIRTCLDSNLVIIWGYNFAESNRRGTDAMRILHQAKARGARLVVVDPVQSATALAADQWIPIRPGTDALMLLAMAHVIINEDLYNHYFVEQFVHGFAEFSAHVQKYTPEYAEQITGVPAKTIVELAREYATRQPAALFAGDGPTRIGAQPGQYSRAAMALAAIVGSFVNPGTNTAGAVGFPKGIAAGPLNEPPGAQVATIPEPRVADAILKGKAGGYPADIRMALILASNMVSQMSNSNKSVEALKKLDFTVVTDYFLTPTARYADILLPVASHFERYDATTYSVCGRKVIFNDKAIEPMYECKSDFQIMRELADRLGVGSEFQSQLDELDWLEQILTISATEQKPWLKGLTVEKLRTEHVVNIGPENFTPFVAQIVNGEPFPTPSGKIELYSETMAEQGLPPLPTYLEEWENPWHPIAQKYPLQIVTPHSVHRAHSMFDNNEWLAGVHKHNGLEPVWLNPWDAEKRGIKNGDTVKVFNDRGAFLGQAQVTGRVMPGVISVYEGGWFNPGPDGVDRGGCVNAVTEDDLDPMGESAIFNSVMVDVCQSPGSV